MKKETDYEKGYRAGVMDGKIEALRWAVVEAQKAALAKVLGHLEGRSYWARYFGL